MTTAVRSLSGKITAREGAAAGAWLMQYAKEQGVKYADIDRKCFLGMGAVSDIINGTRLPTLRYMAAIADRLGVTLDEMLAGAMEPDPEPVTLAPETACGTEGTPQDAPAPAAYPQDGPCTYGPTRSMVISAYDAADFTVRLDACLMQLEAAGAILTQAVSFASIGVPTYKGQEWHAALVLYREQVQA